MVIVQLLYAFFDYFFSNFFLLQKCHEMNKKRFSRLLLHLNIIFMPFWTIYDNSKIWKFLPIFCSKMHYFSLLRGHFVCFGKCFFKMIYLAKIAKKCIKMLIWSFSRSQTLPLCDFESYWTKLNFDFLGTFLTKIVQLIQ